MCTAKLEALEVARGHDGLLRGRPEPTLLLGLGVTTPAGPLLVTRNVVRFGTVPAIPATSLPREVVRLTADHDGSPVSFFLLALAFEEDGGDDVSAIFGALEAPVRWSVCSRGAPVLEPLDIAEASAAFGARPVVVEPMLDGGPVSSESDELVGATFLVMATDKPRRGVVRLHFVSDDGRNDWTARVFVTVRSSR